ncbi:related to replication factor C, subunit RFC1 (large subunit) [Ramularia collo-cygni]|uniref:Replication factor C subunit 1 n=1 Tax=Ramularia collo-cygni TaxID=112498 RepID=A0A2D3VP38_9PEZI|nr:related to replication factor C, subunit RFC1 (large subunit) [Ramularia collo-cygni]CZT24794.1 related to replication factor C, subunit RFC1 (large subunit) [Ramularia collo-cygni]
MPTDIRSFFGGKPAGTVAEKPKPKAEDKTKKRGRGRKIVEDDDDDNEDEEPATKKAAASKKTTAKKPEPEPELEETTADDFFAKGKPKRTADVRPKPIKKAPAEETPKKKPAAKSKSAKSTPNGRASTRTKKETHYVDLDADDFPDDDLEGDADDVAKVSAATGRRLGDDYREATDDEDDLPLVPKKRQSGKQKKIKDDDEDDFTPDGDVDMKDTNPEDDVVVPDEDERIVENKPAKKTPAKASAKRKSTALDEDDDDLEIEQAKPAKKRAAPTKKATPAKKNAPKDSAELKAIFDSIPTIEPPPPPPKADDDGEKKKTFQFGAHANSAVPAGALSSADIPTGNDNCLAGLKFVFTGQLQQLGREQGQALVKQYGGHVMTAPSKNTSFVVLGEDAGPKKLETIEKLGLKVINEEGLFALISKLPANGGDGAAAEKQAEKQAKEEEKIRAAAAEIDAQEKAKAAAAAKSKSTTTAKTSSAPQQAKAKAAADAPDSRLWTVRYAPQSLSQICGNQAQVIKLQTWLRMFPKNQRTGFKMPGKDGSGTHRAIMIHGPPGIGKTTAAHLVAKMEGYDIVESNASDTRSKKLVENGLKGVMSTTSLMGYFASGSDDIEVGKKKLVLIMDEVDGMSAGDRGGVGALAAVCKKTQVPMILICNDRKLPKMKPFDFVTFDLPFRRPTTDMIRSRISTIAFREGLKMPPNVINALIEGSGADIRQVVNMISTAKLDSQNLSFEDSKDMSKAWQKHIVLKPWDMVGKILGGGLFNPSANSSLNDKTELYFNDHEFAPLMLQENYLGTNPQRSNQHNGNPKRKRLSELDLVSKAADSISDGDLVDRMIHGSQQQWSLMPAHAIFSFVRPASFVYGSMAGHKTQFTSWLGKNSNQGKLMRFIKEIQGHMRLRVSADRHEIRQTYLPMLFEKLIVKLRDEGKEAVPEIIELMDSYYLTKDDWDAILELGVGQADMENIKIETQAKSTFTRLYNLQSHPLPFMKASEVVAPKKAPPKEKPDLEEAFDESEDEAPLDDVKEEDNVEADLSKDKYVAKPKKKRASTAGGSKASSKASGSKAAGSKRNKAAVDDDEEDEEEDVKPKKGKGRAKK